MPSNKAELMHITNNKYINDLRVKYNQFIMNV